MTDEARLIRCVGDRVVAIRPVIAVRRARFGDDLRVAAKAPTARLGDDPGTVEWAQRRAAMRAQGSAP